MKNSPLFSIVCPFYNGEKFLAEAIETVLKQTYTNWELILVDDGSIDNSQNIAKSFLSSKVRYYKNDNHGVLYSRYYGVEKSIGKYIVFLDCDDLLPKNALEIYQKNIEVYHPDIVFSDTSAFSDEGYKPRIYHNKSFKILDNDNKYAECYFDNRFGYYHNAACFKRNLFNKHKLPDLFKDHVYTEDLIDTYFLISDANSIVLITDVLYLYRKHSQSKSKSNMKPIDFYQSFLSYNYIYEDIIKRKLISFPYANKQLVRDLSYCGISYFVCNFKVDERDVFKKCAKNISKSFVYNTFTKHYKFVGKRYKVLKFFIALRLFGALRLFCSRVNRRIEN